ncbi:hypothetical protein AAF712_012018 [Marasmius tenuissimus]|uniref:Uncharacterized protein n=1 Tax=Marasmius tenuissimus TaxID=585030 RepID=A0ABR2ZIF8_9AGAR
MNPEISGHTPQHPAERSKLGIKLKSLQIEEKGRLKKENKLLQDFRKVAKLAMRAQELKEERQAHQTYLDQQRLRFTCIICDRLFVSPQTYALPRLALPLLIVPIQPRLWSYLLRWMPV